MKGSARVSEVVAGEGAAEVSEAAVVEGAARVSEAVSWCAVARVVLGQYELGEMVARAPLRGA